MQTITLKGFDEIDRDLRKIGTQLDGPVGKRILGLFFQWFKVECLTAWGNVKAAGGTFRGVTWPGMKNQYTRKTDGVTVPFYGGVAKVHGRGNVKAKKRPSGKRVTQSSVMMQDTGNMRNSIFTSPIELTGNLLRIGPRAGGVSEEYAVAQEKRRNVVFWAPGDEEKLHTMARAEADRLVEKFNNATI